MLTSHTRTQIARFARLWTAAFIASGVLAGGAASKRALVAAAVGALEVAFRAAVPTVPRTDG